MATIQTTNESIESKKEESNPNSGLQNGEFSIIFNPNYFVSAACENGNENENENENVIMNKKRRELICYGYLRQNDINPRDIVGIIQTYYKDCKFRLTTVKSANTSMFPRCERNMGIIVIKPTINEILSNNNNGSNQLNIKYVENTCDRHYNSPNTYFIHFGVIGFPKNDSNCNFTKFEKIFIKLNYEGCGLHNLKDTNKHFPSFQTLYIRCGKVGKNVKNPYNCSIGINQFATMIELYKSAKTNNIYSIKVGDTISLCLNDKCNMYFIKNNEKYLIGKDKCIEKSNLTIENGAIKLDFENYDYYPSFATNRCFCADNSNRIDFDIFLS